MLGSFDINGDLLVLLADRLVLITRHLLVLLLLLVHERLELGVIALRDSLGRHDDLELAAGDGLNAGLDLLDGLCERGDTDVLVETLRGEDVEGGRDELDFNGCLRGVFGFGLAERSLDGLDTFVAETLDRDVRADLCGLGGEALGDVSRELLLDGLRREFDALPDVGVAARGLVLVVRLRGGEGWRT